MAQFGFYRLRLTFRALDGVRFPWAKSGNTLRGALGVNLREAAPAVYERLFALPRRGGADPPRPMVLRAAHLSGRSFEAGDSFAFDVHLFDAGRDFRAGLEAAFSRLADSGIGPGRGRAVLESIAYVDLHGNPAPAEFRCLITLHHRATAVEGATVLFATPTELKAAGSVAPRPDLDILFARIFERLSALSLLYGSKPLEADLRAMLALAAQVRTVRCDVEWVRTVRRSTRTGLVHRIGGFTGEVEYEGELAPFLPWLRAARWTGVGRHTVWGNGEIHVLRPAGNE